MSDALNKALSEALDRDFERILMGGAAGNATTTAAPRWGDGEPLTISKINTLLATLPTRETWVVSYRFPPEGGVIAKTPDENFTCLSVLTWARVQHEVRKLPPPPGPSGLFGGVTPTFIDPDPRDSADTAAWRAKEATRIWNTIDGAVTASIELKRIVDAWWRRL